MDSFHVQLLIVWEVDTYTHMHVAIDFADRRNQVYIRHTLKMTSDLALPQNTSYSKKNQLECIDNM